MAVKLPRPSLVSSRSSNGTCVSCKRVVRLDYLSSSWGNSRRKLFLRYGLLDCRKNYLNRQSFANKKIAYKSWRLMQPFHHASAEDGVAVNGSPQTRTGRNVEEMRAKLTESLQDENNCDGLIQSLHDAARIFELAVKEKISFSKLSWFSAAWLGVDTAAWVKTLSYQASVYSLLQAANEISSRGNNRDKDVNVFVQRSLSRQTAPLESMMRDNLSCKQPGAYEWFWSEQVPSVVTSFVNYFEGDHRFVAATSVYEEGKSSAASNENDVSLLMLLLTCITAITKLGPAKLSCSHFFSLIPDTTGRLMDKLVDFVPIPQAYHSIKSIGLHREFLAHFGPRAAAYGLKSEQASDEVVFWVDLVQKQLQQAIDREKIWSRLTTSESIEVLERDLAVFGFFIALGRSTQSYLTANGFDSLENHMEDFVRYLIGGSVLYYPQLSSISSYQLYVEVVCEELEWIPFYPNNTGTPQIKQSHGHRPEGPPNYEAIPQVLNVCSYWLQSFIKYSKWLDNPSNVKAAKFLSTGHNKLVRCMEELGILKKAATEVSSVERCSSPNDKQSDSFDKALGSVDEALVRLENLLQQLHVSSSHSRKEHLKAACCDLEKIRKLKKEAEFLEASFRARAASLQQGDDESDSLESSEEQQQYLKGRDTKTTKNMVDRGKRVGKNRGLWGLFVRSSRKKADPELLGNDYVEKSSANVDSMESEPNEIYRFELLRKELIELEKRVQKSTDQSENEEITSIDVTESRDITEDVLLVQTHKENFIEKTFDKLKGTTTDVWQGTQLLAIDTAAAMELLRRALIGDELTEKEKKALRRTMTDLASVVPIGVLMLLPVTAVGHAAMLAAIQRYVPALIPSTYGPERLNLLRQLEKVKETQQTNETEPEEGIEEIA